MYLCKAMITTSGTDFMMKRHLDELYGLFNLLLYLLQTWLSQNRKVISEEVFLDRVLQKTQEFLD